jgi:tyrosyl-tRNA synthetase
MLSQEEVEDMIARHNEAPHQRLLQNYLAEDLTRTVHSEEALQAAKDASQILFGRGTTEQLKSLDEDLFLSIFEGVPQSEISLNDLLHTPLLDILSAKTGIFKSNGEARRMIKDNAVAVNKSKIKDDFQFSEDDLLNGKYILVQKGKKNYFIIRITS